MMATNNLRARMLILAMFIFLGFMLAASLWQRFNSPGLVIHRFATHAPQNNAAPQASDGMGAVGELMRTVAANPNDLEATLKLVEALMAMGQWEVAENFAQKALAIKTANPRESRPLYLLALIHHNRKEHEQAAELLEKTLEKDENPSARYSLGILYIHYLDKPERGADELRKGLSSGRASPSLEAAMKEELEKITKALPAEDREDLARPLEDAPAEKAAQ